MRSAPDKPLFICRLDSIANGTLAVLPGFRRCLILNAIERERGAR